MEIVRILMDAVRAKLAADLLHEELADDESDDVDLRAELRLGSRHENSAQVKFMHLVNESICTHFLILLRSFLILAFMSSLKERVDYPDDYPSVLSVLCCQRHVFSRWLRLEQDCISVYF